MKIFSLLYVNSSPTFTLLPDNIVNSESKSTQAVNLVCTTSGCFHSYYLWRWRWYISFEKCVIESCQFWIQTSFLTKMFPTPLFPTQILRFKENFATKLRLSPYPSCSCSILKHSLKAYIFCNIYNQHR